MKEKFTILINDSGGSNQFNDQQSKFTLHFQSIVSSLIDKYKGALVDYNSDENIILFQKPYNALQYAIDLFQRSVIEPRIPYRIGISYGFVERNPDGFSGDPFQTALRLQRLGAEGATLLSEDVVKLLPDDERFHFQEIGKIMIKGIARPVQVYALANKGFYVPSKFELAEKQINKNSVAVLPFHNTSSERTLDYICQGLAEEIIDTLTKADDLFVTARTSSFIFKKRDHSINDISKKLNVNYVFDGSIRKRNHEYRISYQLVDTSSGFNAISNSMTSDFDGLYDCEKRISRDILKFFKETVEEEIVDNYYLNPQAYDLYLKGKYLVVQWNIDAAQKAISLFKKALELVPEYALAYAGLSFCYTHMALNGYADYKSSLDKALHFAEQSIRADQNIPDGYISKAIALFWKEDWYVPDFEENITKALTISPCDVEVRMFNGMLFLFKGELKRSLSELLLAKQLDPYSTAVNMRLGLVQYLNKEYEDAHNTYLSILNEGSYRTYSIIQLAWCCIQLRQYDKALDYLSQARNDISYYGRVYACYITIYFYLKDEKNFFKYKDIIENLPEDDVTYHYNLAVLYKLLDKPDLSISYLEKTLHNKITKFLFLQFDAFWQEYHQLPTFINLINLHYNPMEKKMLKIDSDTKEYLEIKATDFLYAEAQDNYSTIIYIKNNKITERLLRVTLSHVEQQIKVPEIIRCHRSYLVNLLADFQFFKSDNKAWLKIPELDIEIPVSRSKEKLIKQVNQD